jgi:hypothetical protein
MSNYIDKSSFIGKGSDDNAYDFFKDNIYVHENNDLELIVECLNESHSLLFKRIIETVTVKEYIPEKLFSINGPGSTGKNIATM